MTPPDCNLRGLPFMPLQVQRLIELDLYLLSSGDEFKAAISLWCKSWSQLPGGSLPDDDKLLGPMSGAKSWPKVKAVALRGWVKCSDGRLYHAVVAENALQAWDSRQDHIEVTGNKMTRQQRWREQLKELSAQLRAHGVTPPAGATKAELERLIASHVDIKGDGDVDGKTSTQASTVDGPEMGSKGQGQSKGQGNLNTAPDGALPPSGQSPKVAELQKLIHDIEGKGGAYKPPPCPHKKVLELWKALLPALPQHTVWTAKRSKHLQSRWRETAVAEKWTSVEDGLHYFAKLFRWVGTSRFLTGQSNPSPGRTTFVIELEWLINPSNWAKVIEGKYHTEG
nr:MAG TPA: Protein of unknown function (DUF1376) [Caudoviricetes sp.]